MQKFARIAVLVFLCGFILAGAADDAQANRRLHGNRAQSHNNSYNPNKWGGQQYSSSRFQSANRMQYKHLHPDGPRQGYIYRGAGGKAHRLGAQKERPAIPQRVFPLD